VPEGKGIMFLHNISKLPWTIWHYITEAVLFIDSGVKTSNPTKRKESCFTPLASYLVMKIESL
jgi:hypothetical protein